MGSVPTSARESGLEFGKSMDERRLPDVRRDHLAAPHALLRRFLRRQLGEQRSVSGRAAHRARPALEKQFRLIPEANARFLTGGSTGGWECAALQIQRPDFFGGGVVPLSRSRRLPPQPDRRHLRRLERVLPEQTRKPPVPERSMSRTPEGQDLLSFRLMSRLEAVLGSKARSGQQFDAWDAAYGPVGADGYPKRSGIARRERSTRASPRTGATRDTTSRGNLVSNWSKIGPSLAGKMHVYVGDMDNYYLNLGVYRWSRRPPSSPTRRRIHVRVRTADEAARMAADHERRDGANDGCVPQPRTRFDHSPPSSYTTGSATRDAASARAAVSSRPPARRRPRRQRTRD